MEENVPISIAISSITENSATNTVQTRIASTPTTTATKNTTTSRDSKRKSPGIDIGYEMLLTQKDLLEEQRIKNGFLEKIANSLEKISKHYDDENA